MNAMILTSGQNVKSEKIEMENRIHERIYECGILYPETDTPCPLVELAMDEKDFEDAHNDLIKIGRIMVKETNPSLMGSILSFPSNGVFLTTRIKKKDQ